MIKYEESQLEKLSDFNFKWTDKYGDVIYKQLQTVDDGTVVNGEKIPAFSVFTKPSSKTTFSFCGIVSPSYLFVGHDFLNENVKAAISETGEAIFEEQTFLSENIITMDNRIAIRHPTVDRTVGNVYPVIVIRNNYNGLKRVSIQFGLWVDGMTTSLTLFGSFDRIHVIWAPTQLSGYLANYINVFTGSISELLNENFNKEITEREMLATLDIVEEVGKRKREKISEILNELIQEDKKITTWKIFLAILRYTTMEKNLNAKAIMENIAERVLIVPKHMMDVVGRLRNGN